MRSPQKILRSPHGAEVPLLTRPWIMHQAWHHLLFAHWPLPPAEVAARLPSGMTLDTFAGQAWVGVVPFLMRQVRPRAVPAVPWLSFFPECNVRTYVIQDGRPGVYFFSLDAGNPLAVWLGRTLFHLPYADARFQIARAGDEMTYQLTRRDVARSGARFSATYRPVGPVLESPPGSLTYWLTERYCLYTISGNGQVLRGEVRHAPWPLQPATAEIAVETLSKAAGLVIPPQAPLLHYARRLEVLAWALESLDAQL